jgi:hypothetical protein
MQLQYAYEIIIGGLTIFGSIFAIFGLASLLQRCAQDYYDRGR